MMAWSIFLVFLLYKQLFGVQKKSEPSTLKTNSIICKSLLSHNCSFSRLAFQMEKFKRWGRKHTCKSGHLQKGYLQIPFVSKDEKSRRYRLQLFPADWYNDQPSCLQRNVEIPGNPTSKVLSVFLTHYWMSSVLQHLHTRTVLHCKRLFKFFVQKMQPFFIRKGSWFSLLSICVYFIPHRSLRISDKCYQHLL